MIIPIQSWDVIMINEQLIPIIQIDSNSEITSIKIQDTQSCYDNIIDSVSMSTSPINGKCILIPQHMTWQGYPLNLGSIEVEDNVEIVEPLRLGGRRRVGVRTEIGLPKNIVLIVIALAILYLSQN
jgi:hypothetical protein